VCREAGDVGIQSDAKDSICVRDRRTVRSRLRVNAEGIPYVLDSEDVDSGMEVNADGIAVTAKGAATANGAGQSLDKPPMAGTEAAGEDLPLGPTGVSPDDASSMEVAPEVGLAPGARFRSASSSSTSFSDPPAAAPSRG